MTEIKRLKQNGKEFAPITLSEAVVVNTNVIPQLANIGITTLDKVLGSIGLSFTEFKNQLNKKQDTLTAGTGIVIEQVKDAEGNVVGHTIKTTAVMTLYQIMTPEQFQALTPSKDVQNKIYLVPYSAAGKPTDVNNVFIEYICVEKESQDAEGNPKKDYFWEKIGERAVDVEASLGDYLTWDKYIQGGGITAENVTTSLQSGKLPVVVTYDIPSNLYDDVIAVDDNDGITSKQGAQSGVTT